ncbi:MAG: LA_3696 family protein [bacterium]
MVTVEKPLREKLGDEGTDSLVRLINQSQENQKNNILEFIEEKFERRLAVEVGRVEKNLIKWMFIFWVGQVGMILGILFAFFK